MATRSNRIVVQVVVLLAASALGLAVGHAWRSRVNQKPKTDMLAAASTVASVPQKRFSSSVTNRSAVRVNDDSPLATQLERDLSMSQGVTRWLHWLEAVEKASPGDFPRLARLAQKTPTAMQLVAARWVEIAPQHVFDAIVTATKSGAPFPIYELSNVLFDEWPKRDIEAVVAALDGAPNIGQRRNWRIQVVNTVIRNDVERGLKLLSAWNVENYGPHMDGVEKWAATDPRYAAEFALAHPSGYASRLAMEAIGKQWAQTDPVGAMEFAARHRGELPTAMAASALKSWAARNRDEAAEWLSIADLSTRNRLSSSFVEAWAQSDARGALAWCEENLSGSVMANAVGGVLKGAAAKNISIAAELVGGMEPSRARSEAAAAVLLEWMPGYASDKPVPDETVRWLKTLDADSAKRALGETHWIWAQNDPRGLASYVSSVPSDHIPPFAEATLARNLAQKNPDEALKWAAQLPDERSIHAGNEAFNEWRRYQPEQAMQWLNKLPASDERRTPFFERVIQLVVHEPHPSETLASLSGPDQAAARKIIADSAIPEERRKTLLESIQAHNAHKFPDRTPPAR